jgi:hypothetical protein
MIMTDRTACPCCHGEKFLLVFDAVFEETQKTRCCHCMGAGETAVENTDGMFVANVTSEHEIFARYSTAGTRKAELTRAEKRAHLIEGKLCPPNDIEKILGALYGPGEPD